jgi:hypothetical protein
MEIAGLSRFTEDSMDNNTGKVALVYQSITNQQIEVM